MPIEQQQPPVRQEIPVDPAVMSMSSVVPAQPLPQGAKGGKIPICLMRAQSSKPKPWLDPFWFWAEPTNFPLL